MDSCGALLGIRWFEVDARPFVHLSAIKVGVEQEATLAGFFLGVCSHVSMKLASLCKLMVPFLRLHLSLI